MKIRRLTSGTPEKVELNMTPMIDVVFQLLAFFIMTLKIVSLEGDFNIKMPAPGTTSDQPPLTPPVPIELVADGSGRLQLIRVSQETEIPVEPTNPRPALDELQRWLIGYLEAGGASRAEDAEVEFDLDPSLRYEYVIGAISAVTGRVDRQTRQIVPLVERIKFTPLDE